MNILAVHLVNTENAVSRLESSLHRSSNLEPFRVGNEYESEGGGAGGSGGREGRKGKAVKSFKSIAAYAARSLGESLGSNSHRGYSALTMLRVAAWITKEHRRRSRRTRDVLDPLKSRS